MGDWHDRPRATAPDCAGLPTAGSRRPHRPNRRRQQCNRRFAMATCSPQRRRLLLSHFAKARSRPPTSASSLVVSLAWGRMVRDQGHSHSFGKGCLRRVERKPMFARFPFCPFCDIRWTLICRRRHSKASPPRRSLDRPDPRDRNAGSTGTPCAKQPLGLFQASRAEIGLQ
jgi:hypothetical protein